jgi:hypothetical protein
VAGVADLPSIWGGWPVATCFPDHCFCEATRDQLVRQPANAVSGAAFIGVAVLVLLAPAGPLTRTFRALYASAAAIIGAATIFYHASLTFAGQTADVLGMYLIVTLVLVDQLARRQAWRVHRVAATYLLGNSVLLGGLILLPQARRYVFAALVVLVIILELAGRAKRPAQVQNKLFRAAVALLLGGFVAWVLDIMRITCSPASWLQGHALWHVAGALAAWLLYRYLQTARTARA